MCATFVLSSLISKGFFPLFFFRLYFLHFLVNEKCCFHDQLFIATRQPWHLFDQGLSFAHLSRGKKALKSETLQTSESENEKGNLLQTAISTRQNWEITLRTFAPWFNHSYTQTMGNNKSRMTSVRKFLPRERCFSSCHERGTKKKFWALGFRAPMLYQWATETPRWARSITKFVWHASCILLGSTTSIA